MEEFSQNNAGEYGKNYSDEDFWSKIKRFAGKAGAKVVYYALLLYYVMKSPSVQLKDKALIVGALGYFILPVDLIPDFIPVVGFGDDLTALIGALKMVKSQVTPEINQQAIDKLRDFFGSVDVSDFQNF